MRSTARLRLWLVLMLPICIGLGPVAVRADHLLITGETWNTSSLHGMIPTPSGIDFDIDEERLEVLGVDIDADDLIVFDLDAGTLEVYDETSPAELLAEDALFQTFAREFEVRAYTDDLLYFACDPSDASMATPGALTWLGELSAPPGAGGGSSGGGGGGSDSDGDGVTNAADNCPSVHNPSQANNDGDALGDACDGDDDNDGLSDLAETGVHGTNPFLADTDGDGLSDFDEVAGGSDPLDPGDPGDPPISAVPGLGLVGWIVLSALLLWFGYWLRRPNRADV